MIHPLNLFGVITGSGPLFLGDLELYVNAFFCAYLVVIAHVSDQLIPSKMKDYTKRDIQ